MKLSNLAAGVARLGYLGAGESHVGDLARVATSTHLAFLGRFDRRVVPAQANLRGQWLLAVGHFQVLCKLAGAMALTPCCWLRQNAT